MRENPNAYHINSIKPPKEIFKSEIGEEPWAQFIRRFRVVEVKGPMDAQNLVELNIQGRLNTLLQDEK